MLTVDATDTIKSLQEYKIQLEEKMKQAVWKTMHYWADVIINVTPVGDLNAFMGYYIRRKEIYGWQLKPGLLMGNYTVTLNSPDTTFDSGSFDNIAGANFHGKVRYAENNYKLGDTVYITNNTPYLYQQGINAGGAIEAGYSKQAPQGIKQPSLEAIQHLYKIEFDNI